MTGEVYLGTKVFQGRFGQNIAIGWRDKVQLKLMWRCVVGQVFHQRKFWRRVGILVGIVEVFGLLRLTSLSKQGFGLNDIPEQTGPFTLGFYSMTSLIKQGLSHWASTQWHPWTSRALNSMTSLFKQGLSHWVSSQWHPWTSRALDSMTSLLKQDLGFLWKNWSCTIFKQGNLNQWRLCMCVLNRFDWELIHQLGLARGNQSNPTPPKKKVQSYAC